MRDMADHMRSGFRLIVPGVVLCLLAGVSLADGINPQSFSQVERGRYLAIVGDCAACHTLPGSGHELAGGRVLETPFGNLIAPNITPDPVTGIGAWSDDEFVNAMRQGRGRNGTRLYPGMPYTYYTRISRDDALAIRAWLNTLPAVHNPVEADQLPFPFNIRLAMAVWNWLFFKPGQLEPVAGKSAEWNRGALLTEGLGHCGLCHTPKNFLGGDRTAERMKGYDLQGWFAPDITNDPRRGLGGWSVEEVVSYLKTGHNRTGAATGLMAETLTLSTSHMTDADLRAIAVYLKDDDGRRPDQSAPAAPDRAVMTVGAKIYGDECSGCHMPDGKGIAGLFPSLDGSPVVQQSGPTTLLHVVLRGARSAATAEAPTAAAMPEFGWVLNDDQVAAVLTYIRNAWGNEAPPVSGAEARKAREDFIERGD